MFEPKAGMPQWEIVTGVFSTKNINDIVTDEELLEALGPDFPRSSLHSVVSVAIKKFRVNKRTFERVWKTGWRMVEASEHSRLAKKQQVKAVRRVKDALSISIATNLRELNPEQRREQQAEELHYRRLADILARRVAKVEKRVGAVEKDHLHTEDRLDRLTDLLRRHGITDDE